MNNITTSTYRDFNTKTAKGQEYTHISPLLCPYPGNRHPIIKRSLFVLDLQPNFLMLEADINKNDFLFNISNWDFAFSNINPDINSELCIDLSKKILEYADSDDIAKFLQKLDFKIIRKESNRWISHLARLGCAIEKRYWKGNYSSFKEALHRMPITLYLKESFSNIPLPKIGNCSVCNKPFIQCEACKSINRSIAMYCTSCGHPLNFDKVFKEEIDSIEIIAPRYNKVESLAELRGPGSEIMEIIQYFIHPFISYGTVGILFPFGKVLLLNLLGRSISSSSTIELHSGSIDPYKECYMFQPIEVKVSFSEGQFLYKQPYLLIASLKALYLVALLGDQPNNFYRLETLSDHENFCQRPIMVGETLYCFKKLANQEIFLISGKLSWNEFHFLTVYNNQQWKKFVSPPVDLGNDIYFFFDEEYLYLVQFSIDSFEVISKQKHDTFTKELAFCYPAIYNGQHIFQVGISKNPQNEDRMSIYRISFDFNKKSIRCRKFNSTYYLNPPSILAYSNSLFVIVDNKLYEFDMSGSVIKEFPLGGKEMPEASPKICGHYLIYGYGSITQQNINIHDAKNLGKYFTIQLDEGESFFSAFLSIDHFIYIVKKHDDYKVKKVNFGIGE